jgi:hypothetical protein
MANRQVSWWSVHRFVVPFLQAAGQWPMLGSPAWCALPDDDPAKLAALLDASRHWALRVETCQTARCEASHAISAAANWSGIAQHLRNHREFYTARPWLKRVTP